MRTSGAQNTLLHTSHTRHLEGCLAHPFSVTSRASPTDPPKMSDTPSLGTQSPRPAPIPTVISYKHRAYATMPPPNQFPPLIQAYTTAQSFLLRPGEGKKQVGRHKRCTPGAHANLGGDSSARPTRPCPCPISTPAHYIYHGCPFFSANQPVGGTAWPSHVLVHFIITRVHSIHYAVLSSHWAIPLYLYTCTARPHSYHLLNHRHPPSLLVL